MDFKNKEMRWLLFLILVVFPGSSAAADVALLVLDAYSCLANLAVGRLESSVSKKVVVVSAAELAAAVNGWRQKLNSAQVIIVDVMERKLETFLGDRAELKGKHIYVLRSSADDENACT